MDWVAAVLTVVGAGLSLGAVVSAAQRVALLQWNAQKAGENLNLLDLYGAGKGDSTAAKRMGQAEERERIRTGRAAPKPPSTASEFRRQEFGRPVGLAVAGIAVSMAASLLSLGG
jgi:hypothetical protein